MGSTIKLRNYILINMYVFLFFKFFNQPFTFKIMSRGRPALEDIRKHFEKVTEVDEYHRKTPRQKCNYCGNDTVDLIDRLKDHLAKCKKLPNNIKNSVSLITSKNWTNISESTSSEEQSLDKIDADKKLARFFYSTGIPFTVVENPYWLEFIKTIQPAYISPNRRNLANNLLDAEYQVEQQDLNTTLANITLASDGWSNIRRESVLNFVLCLPKPVFYDAKYTGAESHTAEFIYQEFKSIIEDILPYLEEVYTFENAAHVSIMNALMVI